MGIRFDISPADLRAAHKTDEGYFIVDAVVSRSGVFPYRRSDGSMEYEARHPDDVADKDSLASLGGKPVVLLHPREDGKPVNVTPDNVAQYQVGTVGTEFTVAGGHVRAQLVIHRRDAIDAIEKRGVRELSPGYSVKEDRTPGELDGIRFDLSQRDIRYNHIAIVPAGRQGPAVAMRIDDGDGIQIENQTPPPVGKPPQRNPMGAKVRIDAIEVEVADASAAKVIDDAINKRDADIKTANADSETKQKRIDELEGEVEGLKAAAKKTKTDAEVEAERIAWASERADLTAAAGRLGVKLDEDDSKLSNSGLRRKVVDGVEGVTVKEDASDEHVAGLLAGLLNAAPSGSRIDGAFTPTPTASNTGQSRLAEAAQKRADSMLNPEKASA